MARGTLTAEGCAIAETFHLLEEALRSGAKVETVICSESVRSAVEHHVGGLRGLRVVVVSESLFQTVAATESSQGVLALVRPKNWTLEHLFRGQTLVVVVDGVQDPGNLGAILRASEAFGATGLMSLKGTVSVFNPKAVRASAGSLFRLPAVQGLDPELACAALRQHRLEVWAAMPRGGKQLPEADLTGHCALVIGGEGRGISSQLQAAASKLTIPTKGVESLNAALAAGILLYEARRQRLKK